MGKSSIFRNLGGFFGLELTRKRLRDHSVVHKFGRANVGTTFTPICWGGFYRTPTTVTGLEVVSSDVNDTAAGTGAQEVEITGIADDWSEVTQTIELNGTTAVNLTTDLRRVYRWGVSRAGAYASQTTGSHVGDLTIQVQGAGDVWSVIPSTDYARGQSQIGAYTIRAKKTGFIQSYAAHVDSTRAASLLLLKRENADDVATPFTGAMRTQIELDGVLNDSDLMPLSPLGPFPEKTDLMWLAKVATGTGFTSIDFEIIEVDV